MLSKLHFAYFLRIRPQCLQKCKTYIIIAKHITRKRIEVVGCQDAQRLVRPLRNKIKYIIGKRIEVVASLRRTAPHCYTPLHGNVSKWSTVKTHSVSSAPS